MIKSYILWVAHHQVLEAYFKYMVELGVMMGGERNETKSIMLEVFNFERSLNEVRRSFVWFDFCFTFSTPDDGTLTSAEWHEKSRSSIIFGIHLWRIELNDRERSDEF